MDPRYTAACALSDWNVRLYVVAAGRGNRNRLAVLDHSCDVQFDRFANEPLGLGQIIRDGHASRQVGYIRANTGRSLLVDYSVLVIYSLVNPACLKMLLRVPLGTSFPGCPATVTRPDFMGCLNCR